MDGSADRPDPAAIRRALAECMTLGDIDDAMGWATGTARRRRWWDPAEGGLPPADAELGGVPLWFRATIARWMRQEGAPRPAAPWDGARGAARPAGGPAAEPATEPTAEDVDEPDDERVGAAADGLTAEDLAEPDDEPTAEPDVEPVSEADDEASDDSGRDDSDDDDTDSDTDSDTDTDTDSDSDDDTDDDTDNDSDDDTDNDTDNDTDTDDDTDDGDEPPATTTTAPASSAGRAHPGPPAGSAPPTTGFALVPGQDVLALVHGGWFPAVVVSRARRTVVVDYRLGPGRLDARRQRVGVERVRPLDPDA